MKRLAVLAAVVFTTITLNSCRQSDDILSAEEQATLQKVRDSSSTSLQKEYVNPSTPEQVNGGVSLEDGEIVPPPRK